MLVSLRAKSGPGQRDSKRTPAQHSQEQQESDTPVMSAPQHGDYQFDFYRGGVEGLLPKYPVDFASLERTAADVLLPWVHSYIAGGCGDERTQRANVEAFSRYAIAPAHARRRDRTRPVGAPVRPIDGFAAVAGLRAAGAQRV